MSVREQLERILKSTPLVSSPSLCRFLRYVVEETLAGREAGIKEHHLGVRVFDRGDDFNPRLDPIVRVQARNLRTRLARYYNGPGAGDPIRIELPKGTYVPVFHRLIPEPQTVETVVAEEAGRAPESALGAPASTAAALAAPPTLPANTQVRVPVRTQSAVSASVMPVSVMPVPPPRSPVAENRQPLRMRFLLSTVVLVVILAGIAVLWITRTYAAPRARGLQTGYVWPAQVEHTRGNGAGPAQHIADSESQLS